MADLAERVDDLICSFDSTGETTMDTLSMLIFGWMLFGLVVLCVGKYVYNRFVLNELTAAAAAATTVASSSSSSSSSSSPLPPPQLGKDGHESVVTTSAAGTIVGRLFNKSKLVSSSSSSSLISRAGTGGAGGGAGTISAGGGGGTVSAAAAAAAVAAAAAAGGGGGTSAVAGARSPSPGGYVPPTPPIRKRLTRKTSGALISPSRSSRALHLPTATGADAEAVRWVNELIVWLHHDFVILNELLATWVVSLNDFTIGSTDEHGVGVEFVRVLPETYPPTLSNIFCECDSKDDVTITCDCEATPALQLKAFRQRGDKVEVNHYRVNVNRFRARLNIVCITEKLLIDLKCDGWPEVKISLAAVGTIKKDLDESQLQEVVTEIVVGALRGTNVHLNLSQYPTCPRLWREPPSQPGFSYPTHYDSVNTLNSMIHHQPLSHQRLQGHPASSPVPMQYVPGERRLLVKVVRAVDLGGQQGAVEPYCVVELDEPPQKNQTSIKKDTKSPLWDEAFLFDISHNTSEVLLEVFDHVNKSQRFLGLGIVGVEELVMNPSQRQIIPLQARPYEQDDITGTLTVEFLFIEGAEVPQIGTKPYKVKETIKPISPSRSYSQNVISSNSLNYNNGNSTLILYDSAAQSEGDYLTNGNVVDSPYKSGQTNGNKGTLIVHSQQRQTERQIVKVRINSINVMCNLRETSLYDETKFDKPIQSVALTENGNWQEVSPEHGTKDVNAISGPESTPNSSNSEERGRTRRKRRDFFGTIKKRLSRSKTRSRSVGPEGEINHEDAHSRSISADRARDPGSAHLSIPEQSRRSSLSEASGISGTSTRTYVNEASTLVLETLENGIKKHYLVPLSLAQKSKWRKKGTKLHIFNDHTFIAKHMTGGTVCEVCKRTLARRLGKQGYECRDCQMKCHKHCHVKVDTTCPTSTIQSIEL
ncbi:C2 domain-containing protein 2 [Cyphomyrmex costatus]|uniref:C2 domain-containing protein 2 n=1 Tax=Cyphomyrmex costatus TaxID=456900 RepID=A0A195C7G2_9HYME|nr:C2 domain-containing protein 2 [Cyphomyrmex costatus]